MKLFMSSKRINAFTLIELMIVVAIIGILAAVSIPVFSKYIKKSKTSETSLNLRKIYDGEVVFYQEEHTAEDGSVKEKIFSSAPRTPPGMPGINKRQGNWNNLGWRQIKFAPDSPVQYAYAVMTSGIGLDASFTANAIGDLDGDAETSLFLRTAKVDHKTGEVEGGGGVYSIDEEE